MNRLISFKSSQESNKFEVTLDESHQTFWVTEQKIAKLFEKDRTVISKHLKIFFKEQELDKNAVCANFAHTEKGWKNLQCKSL
ncbi:MAG: hypothetical protein ACWIPJ_00650 [Polaribacter sp.]